MMNRRMLSGVAVAALLTTACSLDVTNPNAATRDQVITSPAGLKAVAMGLQGKFGNSIEHAVWVPGIVSGELGNTDASQSTSREFQKYPTVVTAIDKTNPDLLNFWARQYQVIRAANDILDNIDQVQLVPGTKSGMTALAKTFKAIALGTLVEAWQAVPLDPSVPNPTFDDRAAVLTQVLSLLASARSDLTTTPMSTEFTSTILMPGIDLPNTIRAMQARFSMEAGQYEQGLSFANDVPANAVSEFRFTTVDQNPVWAQIQSNKYFAAVATFRTNAEAGDTRVNKFTTSTVTTPFGGVQVVPVNVYLTSNAPYPIFTQDELTLIRAEAHARANRLPQALTEVNKVRQAAGLSPIDPNAPTTQAAVLAEIFKQRTYSLFLSGLHWADERRFGRISDAKLQWLPYPAQETVNNPNAPTS